MDYSVDLKINRDLLDANFDGYKLSLDSLPLYKVNIERSIDETNLTEEQYSYQHIKAFGVHNHLFQDPFHPDDIYFVDKSWNICRYKSPENAQVGTVDVVLQVPEARNHQLVPGRYSATLNFPSESLAVLADGAGHLFLIETGDRRQGTLWKISFTHRALEEGQCFTLRYSTCHTDGEILMIEAVLMHVEKQEVPIKENESEQAAVEASEAPKSEEEESSQNNVTAFITYLEWLTLIQDPTGAGWELSRTRRLSSTSSPDYVAVEKRGSAITVASERPFKFIFDSMKPIATPPVDNPDDESACKPPPYTWTQDETDVTIHFTVPNQVTKKDIQVSLRRENIDLQIKNGPTLLCGTLHDPVDVDACTWTLSNQRLELHLSKAVESRTWSEVVEGDKRGELVYDADEVKKIHEKLAALTSDTWNPDPEEGQKRAYNGQELEECDIMASDMASTITRFEGNNHQITHQVNLDSHQWLFTEQITPDSMPAVCLRHDVDGLLWFPLDDAEPGKSPWEHRGTFNALGYVQASKTQKKYAGCALDQSFSVICDCARHIYVYRQPSSISSPLRNRKTGRQVSAVAKQQVVSLQTIDNFVGLCISRDRIYALAGNTLYIVAVNER